MKIGIFGRGFVGSAVEFGFSPQTGCDAEVRVYDKNPDKSTHTLEETVNQSNFIYLSVPTPANKDGSINLDILDSALNDIDKVHTREKDNAILIRSTVIPGTTWSLQTKYPQLNILFNPEFLTERSANFDFINQNRFIIGNNGKMGSIMQSENFVKLIKDRFGDCVAVMETSYETAELIKYMNNCFFATKVSFMNEMYQIAEKIDANWEDKDLFMRMQMEGYKFIMTSKSLIWHFTSRTSRFPNGTKDLDNNNRPAHIVRWEQRATQRFVEKWGRLPQEDEDSFVVPIEGTDNPNKIEWPF